MREFRSSLMLLFAIVELFSLSACPTWYIWWRKQIPQRQLGTEFEPTTWWFAVQRSNYYDNLGTLDQILAMTRFIYEEPVRQADIWYELNTNITYSLSWYRTFYFLYKNNKKLWICWVMSLNKSPSKSDSWHLVVDRTHCVLNNTQLTC